MAAISTPAAPGTFRYQLASFWSDFSASRGALVGLIFIVLILLVALFAPWVAPHDPAMQDRSALLVPPVWHAEGSWDYLLGTDAVGRDILSRLIYGARYSLSISAMVVIISMGAGIFLGLGIFGAVDPLDRIADFHGQRGAGVERQRHGSEPSGHIQQHGDDLRDARWSRDAEQQPLRPFHSA